MVVFVVILTLSTQQKYFWFLRLVLHCGDASGNGLTRAAFFLSFSLSANLKLYLWFCAF